MATDGRVLPDALLAGRQGRLVLAYLACQRHRSVTREELAEVLWGERLPDSWPGSLSTVISRLRRLLVEAGLDGPAALTSSTGSYRLVLPEDAEVDWEVAQRSIDDAERAVSDGDAPTAITAASIAGDVAGRGFLTDDCAWVDEQRSAAHDICVRASLALAQAHLLAGAASRAVDAARDALAQDPLREASFRVLMRALATGGERGEALRVWERCRTTLVEELGVDPSPETEAVYLEVLGAGAQPPTVPAGAATVLPSGVVTFLLTDIVESSALWERHPAAMAAALERHDELIAEVVTANGGTLLKSKLEGDATVSVFARATAGALAALALRDALLAEPWPDGAAPTIRMALHTGEAFERAGDYFGPALNRAARLRSLAVAGQVLLSQAVAELVRDHLPEGVGLADRGHRDLRGLSRGENVYELAPVDDLEGAPATPSAFVRPDLPAPLSSAGPFVGRGEELSRLTAAWERASAGASEAWLVAGEPGVGKSRLAAECARAVYEAGGVVLYGRCDEELGAPLQPFVEALRSLAPALGPSRLRDVRGIDELSRLVPELGELLPDAAPALRADPDSERYALFDATTELLCAASAEMPTMLVLDDLHWAGKTTLSLLRHLLRNTRGARLLVVGTYRDTELARTHPLASMLADLRREQAAQKLTLSGLEPHDVAAYLRAIGNDDRALGRELAEVTSGNPFFLIEALRHVEETGGRWEPGSLPEGVREATGRRLSQLSDAANDALSVAAVAGTTFDLGLVEQVRGADVLDEMAEAVQAGLVDEEPGAPGRFRFAHALVRQVLVAELVTLKRVRLHRSIAELLEASPGDDPDAHLADLAYHWFECASTGAGDKAVDACRRAADRASERLAYEEAADLYGMAIQALDAAEHVDEDARAQLHLARCDALLTAGDVTGARTAIDALGQVARGNDRLSAWHITYAGQLAVLAEPDRLDEIVESIGDAARAMHEVGDLQGEATARYVHALALERLGQIGAAQRALDEALAAARTADDRRLADAILAEVPPAALWGPSPVTRASGNCLDVVRVLRITAGAPAVESVALRCQAVLEALRGRMDAARRMIASAHRTVDQLGLTHRVLETEVSAGFIELLDGQAEAAEAHLRPAYEDLRDRGLGGEAAQAAALLGRALLMQQRDEEAEQVATEAEKLAGSDLKAAIAWRDVRAEAAARRGETALALDLAREAVDLAAATDALLLVADARLALATVLRATGDVAGADAEALRAVEACEAKGATVLADRARARTTTAAVPSLPTGGDPARVAASITGVEEPFENSATRHQRRFDEAWRAGDWTKIAALFGPNFGVSDRRRMIRVDLAPIESVETMKLIFDAGSRPTTRPLATRGTRLALVDKSWINDRLQLDLHHVSVIEVGADDRMVSDTVLDVEDLDAAYEELDRLYLEGEGAEHAVIVEALQTWVTRMNARDWEGARALWAPDLVVREHRRLMPALDADQWIAGWADTAAVYRRGALRIEHLSRLDATAGVWVLTISGDGTGAPGPYESRSVQVFTHDGSRLRSLDVYDEDHFDDALAHYDELTTSVEELFVNAAVRACRRGQQAQNSRDWPAVQDCFASSYRAEDRRALIGGRQDDAEPFESLRVIFDSGVQMRCEVAATRGERLCLGHWCITTVQDSEIVVLTVARTDADGRVDRTVWFDPGDLDAAFAELDRLFFEEEAAAAPRLWASQLELMDALARRDFERQLAAYGPGFTATGRGLVPWGPVDTAGWVDFHRQMVALRPDVVTRLTHVLAIAPIRMLSVATDFDRDDVEVHNVFVAEFGSDTKHRWLETYGVRQLDEARRRYEQIGTHAALGERFTNAAVRTSIRMTEAFNRKDIAAVMDCWAPDGILEDRRRLLQQSLHGRSEANRQNLEFIARGDGHTLSWNLATRGDRLALGNLGWQGDAAEFTLLVLSRVDDAERFDLIIWFDADDVDAAYAELDRLWEEDAGSRARNFLSFVNDRDWEGAAAQLAVDCLLEDHRPARLGRVVGRDQIVDFYRSTMELTPDAWSRWHQVLSGSDAGIAICSMVGTHDGADYELRAVTVLGRDSERLIRSMDFYDEADLELAFARFDELAAQDTAEDRFANAAVRAYGRFNTALDAGDVQAVEACFAPEFRLDDRRTLLQLTVEGPAYHESIRYIVAGDGITTSHLLATRGDRLSLHHATWDSDGTQISLLIIERVDDQDRIDLGFWFDPDDVDAAYEELDRQYLELGASRSYLMLKRLVDGINERDWGSVEALLAPDSVVDDHRPIRFGELVGRDAFVDFYRSTIELAADARLITHHHIGDDRVGIRLVSLVGTIEGAPFENPAITVYQLDDQGRHTHRDFYGPDQLDEAFGRYDELAAMGTRLTDSPLANAAVRSIEAFKAGFHSGDTTRALEAFAPDIALEDRRRLFRHSLRGREVFEYAEDGVRSAAHLSDELVATRGDRLALIRRLIRFPERTVGVAESERMTLAEIDDRGKFTYLGYFDVDDLDAALEELDYRYIESLDSSSREFYAELVSGAEAYGRDDLERIAGRIRSDFLVHDHRPFGFGTLDRSGWIDHMRRLKDEAPGSQIRFHHIRHTHGSWLRVNSIVGMAQSGEFELLSVHVIAVGLDGLDRTLDIYGIEQLDDALAQFEALGEAQPFTNLATENSARFVAALLSGDRDAVAAVHAPGFLGSDRRRFAQLEDIGSHLYEWRFDGEVHGWSSGSQLVATRGSRLALMRSLVTNHPEPSAPMERDFLALVEVDDGGLRTATILFDVDDLDAAFEELDARYVALGGPDYSVLVRTYAARDWDAFAERFTSDFVVDDRRHGGWGRIDRSTFLDHARELVELSPDARMRITHSRDVPTAGIMLGASFGSVEGGEYEREFVTVAPRTLDGRMTGYHLFDVDDLDEACRLYDELADPLALTPNRADRTLDALKAAYDRRDWDDLRALCTADMVFEDRRFQVQGGVEMFVEHGRAWADQTAEFRRELIATLGDNLCEGRRLIHDEAGTWDVESILVCEVDDDGRLAAFVIFEGEDRAGAAVEINGRYNARRGAPERIWALLPAINAHDTAAVRDALAGCMFENHRVARVASLDEPDDLNLWFASMVEVSSELTLETVRILKEGSNGIVAVTRWFGQTEDGAVFDSSWISVNWWDGDGLTFVSVYELDDLDSALARFAELEAAADSGSAR